MINICLNTSSFVRVSLKKSDSPAIVMCPIQIIRIVHMAVIT